MSTYPAALGLAGLFSTVCGHGFVTSPQARMPGDAMAAACGAQVASNQESDNYGNIQGELQVANGQSDYNAAACDIWLCKGYKLDDNKASVQSFTAGQVVPITVDIRAPHTGTANVSIVKTSDHSLIGAPLISWDVYASNAVTIPDDQKNFDITIPSDLGSQCATAGDCVIQWYWDARSIDQTYESCIDFTVGGSGAGNSASPSQPVSSTAPASSAPATSAPASSSAAASPSVGSSKTNIPTSSASAAQNIQTSSAATTPTSAVVASPSISLIPTSIIPSEILTSVLPTALPTGTGIPAGLKPLPAGTTLQDIMDWINYILSTFNKSTSRKHARDILKV
ncbi:uncharacterized protein BDR25DRAFT_327268 [Lindgomyces ingoldianus]|uniref:Uncharacterized protein n=1 Tax=Lindgomyces ingoldianus TaxID=673940 RepID=A0ACB6QLC7_9PLEO|nr:uncharacterized protein BDR25DRAFT_327268 [Lindgomyces ingoldianus]KAF2467731.1 hypothetical protein BDR25DRAFT_327268 [Lindgomyces ingoldianus]